MQRELSTAPAPRSASSKAAMRDWDRAYEAFPGYAADYVWLHVSSLLEAFPGERVYEIGFGSGTNLQWARDHGWEVAGCEVAYAAFAEGRARLRDADLRMESIVDCSAPDDYYDAVVDRAALTYLTPKDLKIALHHVRRIMRPGGVFLFNPYGKNHTKPFPDRMPPVTMWDSQDARRLFPDTKWDLLDFKDIMLSHPDDADDVIENTLRYIVRKIGS